MREREQPDAGGAGELRSLRAVECSVSRARSASSSQKVASCTSTSAPRAASTTVAAGRRVAREHDLAARPRGAEHVLGHDHAPVVERDGLAALELAALRSRRDAERVGGRDVEPAGPRLLANA